ncbi:MAG: chloramphenicol acetyltransferase [Flavobacterium sp.]|nr:MAG: chloramphenicol acetyltransferase [Flavobacterium sp.]
MKKLFDIENWARKAHFNFFNSFEEPFFGVTVNIDCTIAYQKCKKEGLGFFLYYLHQSLAAANSVENFRLRIEDNQIYIYEKVNASAVINRADNSFGFSYIDFFSDFDEFQSEAKIEIENVRNSNGLNLNGNNANVIHISAMPFLKFTSLSHARSFSFNDSCPKFSFGKMTDENGKKTMPISIHVNHALADGYHVGLFVDEFQKRMNL